MAALPSSPWRHSRPGEPIVVRAAAPDESGAARTPETRAPDWIGDIKTKYRLRLSDYFSQALAVGRHPRRFMREWASGTRETLNPLRFYAVGTAISFGADRVGRWALHVPANATTGLGGFLQSSYGGMLVYVAMAALSHLLLPRRTREPFRVTLAAGIFASAGPGALAMAFGWCLTALLYLVTGRVALLSGGGVSTPWAVLLPTYATFLYCGLCMAGAHAKVRARRAIAVSVVAPLLFAVAIMLVAAALFLVLMSSLKDPTRVQAIMLRVFG